MRGATAHWIGLVATMCAMQAGVRAQTSDTAPTFSHDVVPILSRHCTTCHQPEGDAPFSLVGYEEVRQHARQIAAVTASRSMPPWKAAAQPDAFEGERRLQDGEIAVLERWAHDGAPEGAAGARAATDAPASSHWMHGPPDLVLTLAPYTLRADGPDVFRNFTVRVPGTGQLYVRGLQFRPRSRAVHHANIRVDDTNASRQLDDADPDGGYEGVILRSADYPGGQFLGWTPGQAPPLAPADLAWPLRAGSDFVVQLHLYPTGKPETVSPEIGVYLSATPPTRHPSMVRLGRQSLAIPANATDHVIRDSFELPTDAQLLAIQPHAHYRASQVRVSARLPDGSTRLLLHIPQWDFAWQDQYRYATPFWLPAGARIEMEYHFDNSDANPRNPDRPSRSVEWGWRSTDEMADVWLQVRTRSDDDRERFEREARRKMAEEDAIGTELLASRQPTYPSIRNDAALLYLELGRPADALRHFAAVTALQPSSAVAWYNEGLALEALGRRSEAADRYRRAIALNAWHSEAHNNLGSILGGQGRVDEAIGEFRLALDADPRNAEAHNNLGGFLLVSAPADAVAHLEKALELRPDYPEAHFNLARALTMTGRAPAAVAQYRAALATRPDWPPALVNLAWLLAAHPDPAVRRPDDAVALASRAATLTKRADATALDALAAAHAAAGRFADAVNTATDAVDAAERSGRADLTAAIRERLRLYQAGRPFIID